MILGGTLLEVEIWELKVKVGNSGNIGLEEYIFGTFKVLIIFFREM